MADPSRLNARNLLASSFPFNLLHTISSMFLAALTSQFQKVALHRLLVQCKTFRVNWSTFFILACLAGEPDEGQFDTALSQSAWIRAPLGQARLVLVLAAPGADRQARSSSVVSRSSDERSAVVQHRANAGSSAHEKGQLKGSDADILLLRAVTQGLCTWRSANSYFPHSTSRRSWSKAGRAHLFSPMARACGTPRDASCRSWRILEWSRPRPSVPSLSQGTRSAHPLYVRRQTLAHYSSRNLMVERLCHHDQIRRHTSRNMKARVNGELSVRCTITDDLGP
jgi:hypothetical protein